MKNQIVQSTGYLPLSLEETLRLLPHPITTCSVREHVAPGSTARKLEQKFNLRQKDTRRVHAELQMIQCLLQKHIPIQSLFQYMGGSKRNCFLCKTFIEEFCIGFLKTRGCHGKVYHKWMIPEIQGIEQGMVEQLKNTVIEMYDILLKQICQPWRSLDAHPESSGGTTPTTSSAASFASCRRTITRKVKVKKVLTGRLIHHKQITRVFQRMITPSKTAAIAPSLINVHAFWVQQASSVLTDDDGSARVILSQVKSTMRM
ncbi:hypothetical protein FB446DRAFT_753296 [Lentinula raphanica]|nr:hypothetical protein FB446DRAFT_753296 [Lentinula raphanica]